MGKTLPFRSLYFPSLHKVRPSIKVFLDIMIKSILILLMFGFSKIYSQTTVFSDNFEQGNGKWTYQGTWGLVTTKSYSPT